MLGTGLETRNFGADCRSRAAKCLFRLWILDSGLRAVKGVVLSWLLLFSSASYAQHWDLATEFSLTNNPEGAWTVGWEDQLGGDFKSYDPLWGTQNESEIKGFFSPGWFGPVRAWCKRRTDERRMATALPPPGELPYPDHWVEANFSGAEVIRQAIGLPSYPDPYGYVSIDQRPGSALIRCERAFGPFKSRSGQ